jgi:hypothetical protein
MTEIFRSLKREPTGHCFTSMGTDGVLRIWHSDSFEVIDAVRLSTAQIKNYLDRLPFNQDKENKFRGVDGRGVPDENMFSPPEEIRPKRPTEQMLQEHRRLAEERKLHVTRDSKAVCQPRKSDYNLDSN